MDRLIGMRLGLPPHVLDLLKDFLIVVVCMVSML